MGSESSVQIILFPRCSFSVSVSTVNGYPQRPAIDQSTQVSDSDRGKFVSKLQTFIKTVEDPEFMSRRNRSQKSK